MRLCWVDDNIEQAQIFASELDEGTAEVTFCVDGEEALAILQREHFDLLVTDLQMPPGVWGGLWLLSRMVEELIEVPVVVLSGEGSQQETNEAMRLGRKLPRGADYVTKAQVREELGARVREALTDADRAVLASEESERLEFKSTLRADLKGGGVSREVEQAALKTVAALANSAGGLMVIGRADDGNLVGLLPDLKLSREPTVDAWQLHLRHVISERMGPEVNQLVRVRFPEIDGAVLAFVQVEPSPLPVFVRRGREEPVFYVRSGNQTESLGVAAAMRYQTQRWSSR
jgi:CheY-like chemotaxis protein